MRQAKTRLVAVEENLTPVAEALRDKGYTVKSLSPGELGTLGGVEAVVVSGQDSNFLGMKDTGTKAPVINAEGLSADDVVAEVERRLG